VAYLRDDVWERLSRDGLASETNEPISEPAAVIERRKRLRRIVIGVMVGAVAFLVVAIVCGATRASQVQDQSAPRSSPPSAQLTPATEGMAAAADLLDTHGGGPPTSPNAARFHHPKSAPAHKPRNASVLPR
jgi:hypothetical protein